MGENIFSEEDINRLLVYQLCTSHARLAVVFRWNYTHFEGRKVKIKDLFKAIMKGGGRWRRTTDTRFGELS